MVKVLVQLYPVIPATREEREQQRPMGRNRERYQTLLGGWHDIVRAADRLGVWGMATVEHHFHSEGYEVGPTRASWTRTGRRSPRTSGSGSSATS